MTTRVKDQWKDAVNRLIAFLTPAPLEAARDGVADDWSVDTRDPARLGFWVLGAGLGGFFLWAAIAPLNEGVPTSGMVTLETRSKAVQHLSGGLVKAVYVKEGDFVAAGDPLLELDAAAARANAESARLRYYTLRAMEARLLSEQSGSDALRVHPDLERALAADALAASMLENQTALFAARRAALNAELRAMEESIRGQEASLAGYQGLVKTRRVQAALLKEEISGLRDLVAEGYAPRNSLLELERAEAETRGAIADLEGNIGRARRAIAETEQRILQRRQEFIREVEAELADVRSQVEAEGERFEALGDDLERAVIRAPVSGQAVGLVAQTVGGVIAPGQKIMDIVPENEALLLEARIPPHLIDRVRLGQDADARFSAFAHSLQLVVPGKVISVSGDLLTDAQSGVSYYLARIQVTEEGMRALGTRRMRAGMPAEVIIITGERSMLVYLLRPLIRRIAAAMKEE
ncbi:MAG: HlyD family type I secretion periplasmic adaptor subunit [Zoogloeaceae bacterium]|jgi:protease secretion system membrane fusion protein|nr:HlyD family type I secretion periplasmic adaptor subunit [Zoogloeaceae bacterium]